MKVGTKSLLFGVHQVFWHPCTVLLAWCRLYGLPNVQETICIVIHDWGYWNSPDMDGARGQKHPLVGARIADRWLGPCYGDLIRNHSRHFAEETGNIPSRLCWADKLSISFDPWWFYLARAKISGEIKEYRLRAAESGLVSLDMSNRQWFVIIQQILAAQGRKEAKGIRAGYVVERHI